MLSLTNKGRAIYKEALLQWEKAQAYVSKNLGEELKENLLKVSRSVVELKA
ncbi:hypothetical protein [Alkalimarinus coralli]|nr:hypothetical protein [Alkalimarinus coralli]